MKPKLEIGYWIGAIYLVLYEIIALLNAQEDDTISEIHWRLIAEYPVIIFFFGFLMGHLFWQRKG